MILRREEVEIRNSGLLDIKKTGRKIAEKQGRVLPPRAVAFNRLLKSDVAAALRRHHLLKALGLWRGKPAATTRQLGFSATC